MRKPIMLVSALAASVLAVAQLSVASAAQSSQVNIIGTEKVVPNAIIFSTFQFAPGVTVVLRTGDSVTWNDRTGAPHTVSIVRQDQLPKTFQQVMECPICGDVFTAHGDPPAPVVNNGQAGLDTAFAPGTAGDSLFIP